MKLRLAATSCYSTHLCNLLVLVSLDIVKHEDLLRSRRQGAHRSREIHPVAVPGSRPDFLNRRFPFFIFILLYPLAITSFVFSIGEDDVDSDSVNPCRERRLTSELRKLLPRPHEHILRELLASYPASAHTGAECENSIYMRSVKPLERAPVAGGGKCYIR